MSRSTLPTLDRLPDLTAALFPAERHAFPRLPVCRVSIHLSIAEMVAALLVSEFITPEDIATEEQVRFEIASSLTLNGYTPIQLMVGRMEKQAPADFDADNGGAEWVDLCRARVLDVFGDGAVAERSAGSSASFALAVAR
ncbi:hypothetical protein [Embleya sp. NPDC059237]|uniref:hypothetical protein n=1 Tax=Embleya sp. NPDC059237 TaxID=3346784 RepID=UPI00369CB0D4